MTPDRFVELACLFYEGDSAARRTEAATLLAAHPELVAQSARAAAAAGDVDALRAHLDRDASEADKALLALCYSRIPQRAAFECLELLLARGADPNAFTTITDCRFTALTGVMGEGEGGPIDQPPHPDARRMALRLLDAGASANESQGLYNTHFLPSNEWLELLLARGLTSDLDFLLGRAVKQGFVDRVRILLAHGANPDGRDHYNKRRHIENAVLEGQVVIADMLVAAGAPSPQLSPTEAFRAAVLSGDEVLAKQTFTEDPGTLCAAARHNNVDAIGLGLSIGLPIDAVDHGLTALHHAAAEGHLEAVRVLVSSGASTTIKDPRYGGTPLGHARHMATRWPGEQRAEIVAFLAALTP